MSSNRDVMDAFHPSNDTDFNRKLMDYAKVTFRDHLEVPRRQSKPQTNQTSMSISNASKADNLRKVYEFDRRRSSEHSLNSSNLGFR